MPTTKKTWLDQVGPTIAKELSPMAKMIEGLSAHQPSWVLNIGRQLVASMRRAYNIRDDSDSATAMLVGIAVGHFAKFGKTKIHPPTFSVKPPPELAKALKALPKATLSVQEYMGKVSKKMDNAMRNVSPEILIPYSNGYRRALARRQYSQKEPVFWETEATRIYFVLLVLAPVMPRIRSVTELHKILARILGEAVIGRVGSATKRGDKVKQSVRLGKLCERIELKLGNRGRPHAQKTTESP